jgi:hypothetical protein
MNQAHFDALTCSLVSISRRGLLGGPSSALAFLSVALGIEAASGKKKTCPKGKQPCNKKCCPPSTACKKKKSGKRVCKPVCPADAGGCGETLCGNGGPTSNCARTVTAEGEDFCLDFAKANPVGCGKECRHDKDCGPDGVCLCMNNPPYCSCGNAKTSCFPRSQVECD